MVILIACGTHNFRISYKNESYNNLIDIMSNIYNNSLPVFLYFCNLFRLEQLGINERSIII